MLITVTKPFLPPNEEYNHYLKRIWERNWLTNNGPLLQELEASLSDHLKVKYFSFVTNGTTALQIAIRALELEGEIITTPFSHIATTSSITWEACTPVFVDIDSKTFNIDSKKIEAAITAKTSAILATHIFGIPCDVEAIQKIANKHNLKVIYDAAHAFGVQYNDKSIFEYGDISTTSFHATKLFHTIEGGGLFTKQASIHHKIKLLRNFGHTSPTSFKGIGINGKNSEFNAAMGLCNLKYIDSILKRRKEQFLLYQKYLAGGELQQPLVNPDIFYNYAYYAVVFPSEAVMLKIKKELEASNIYCRRYFYPSLSSLHYVGTFDTPIADSVSNRILCLPLYHTLEMTTINFICKKINSSLKNTVCY